MKTTIQTTLTMLIVLALAGCPDSSADDGDADTETEGGACDPEGAIPEVGALLNAPVADDVEVIVKTPQHPGAPGPDNLP